MPFFRHNATRSPGARPSAAQKRLPARRVGGDFVRGDVPASRPEELAVREFARRWRSCALRRPAMLGHVEAVLGFRSLREASRAHHAESGRDPASLLRPPVEGLESLPPKSSAARGEETRARFRAGSHSRATCGPVTAQSRVRLATRVLSGLAARRTGEEDVYEAALAVKWSEWFQRDAKHPRRRATRYALRLKSLEFATLRMKERCCDRRASAVRGRRGQRAPPSPHPGFPSTRRKSPFTWGHLRRTAQPARPPHRDAVRSGLPRHRPLTG